MIRITSQDAFYQYDNYGNAITTWDDKKCAWIVNSKYEDEDIDWWGKNNDFPRGMTLKEFEELNPDWKTYPDIFVTWTWDEESYKKQFGEWNKYPLPTFPTTCTRDWGYLDYTEQEAIEHLGRYCDFDKFATNIKITYNGKIIFNRTF